MSEPELGHTIIPLTCNRIIPPCKIPAATFTSIPSANNGSKTWLFIKIQEGVVGGMNEKYFMPKKRSLIYRKVFGGCGSVSYNAF